MGTNIPGLQTCSVGPLHCTDWFFSHVYQWESFDDSSQQNYSLLAGHNSQQWSLSLSSVHLSSDYT